MQSGTHFDRLRGEGRLAARGEFRLDHEKAREKMQKFQLRDPHHYVLEFVQAAHLLGAQTIRFDIDADEMEMRFDAATLSADDLESIYDAAFSAKADKTTRALRHLAIGLTAAQAMEPSVVRVEVTRDGQTTALVHADGEETVEQFAVGQPKRTSEDDGTRIYLREKFRASHLLEFFRNLGGDLAEKSALREYCAYSPLAITLGDERISFGHHLPEDFFGKVAFETEYERGLVGMVPDGSHVHVTILQNGVKVVEHRANAHLVGMSAVIETERLSKNLSQSAFVEDEQWESFIKHVLPAAMYASVLRYVSRFSSNQHDPNQHNPNQHERAWLERLCDHFLSRTYGLSDEVLEARRRDHALGDLADAFPDLSRLLRRLPLWPTIDQRRAAAPVELVSIDAFIHDESGQMREYVPYTRTYYRELALDVTAPALWFPDGAPQIFERLCAEHLIDLSDEYEAAYERCMNRKLWQSRPWPSRPDRQEYPHQEHFEAETMSATLALAAAPQRDDVRLVYVKDGHLLRQHALAGLTNGPYTDGLLPHGMAVWFAGDLPANRDFDGVDGTDEFIDLASRVIVALPSFIERHIDHFGAAELQIYLSHLLSGKLHKGLLKTFEVDAIRRLNWLRDAAKANPESVWALVDEFVGSRRGESVPQPDEVDRRLEKLGALAHAAIFEELRGGTTTLAELASDYRRHGEIWVVRASADLDEMLMLIEESGVDRLVVRAGHGAEDVLERLFEQSMVYAVKRLIQHNSNGLREAVAATTDKPASYDSAETLVAELLETAVEDVPVEEVPVEDVPEPELDGPTTGSRKPAQPALIARLCDLFVEARGDKHFLLGDELLYALSFNPDIVDVVARTHENEVALSPRHLTTCYARDNAHDPVALAFLAASVYTSINIYYEGITNSHEARFLMRLTDHLERQLDAQK